MTTEQSTLPDRSSKGSLLSFFECPSNIRSSFGMVPGLVLVFGSLASLLYRRQLRTLELEYSCYFSHKALAFYKDRPFSIMTTTPTTFSHWCHLASLMTNDFDIQQLDLEYSCRAFLLSIPIGQSLAVSNTGSSNCCLLLVAMCFTGSR